MHFDERVALQSGRFTRGQAAAAGFSSFRIGRRVDSGEWRAVGGRVLALAAVPDSADTREWETLLRAGPGAVLAGPSAGRHHGMDVPDARPCVLVPPARHLRIPGALVIRRVLPQRDLVLRDEVMLTGRECTIVDCALILERIEAIRLVERALQQGWITFDELTLRARLSTGRHRVEQLVSVIRELGSGARSDTERRLVTGLKHARMRGWFCNHAVYDARGLVGLVDIAFVGAKLAIELDGRAWHVSRDRFQRDRSRQNRLVAEGWTVLRFTWEDVVLRLDSVLADIASALRRLNPGH